MRYQMIKTQASIMEKVTEKVTETVENAAKQGMGKMKGFVGSAVGAISNASSAVSKATKRLSSGHSNRNSKTYKLEPGQTIYDFTKASEDVSSQEKEDAIQEESVEQVEPEEAEIATLNHEESESANSTKLGTHTSPSETELVKPSEQSKLQKFIQDQPKLRQGGKHTDNLLLIKQYTGMGNLAITEKSINLVGIQKDGLLPRVRVQILT
jgi:hypothetical protein